MTSIGGVQARHAAKLLLGASALLGLLLMHGFGGHAAHAAAPASHASPTATVSDATAVDRTPLVASADHPCSQGCAALLLLGTAGQRRPALLQPHRSSGSGPPPRARAGTPAPDLHALSILRC